ncbi:MAG: 16S rRNA (guanine(527)-N(7))-methyltransferase RsmG [Deltaproteobacteria bacterium RIFCSPLOWO2_02_FULL_47_10]|nr:MAG: 16S rRNA (guanine(527)-N(7))-methyltransferase RsmG [Deltaproteobacteria bacterium RIFCSPLOWO2_02_FULL_47_10]
MVQKHNTFGVKLHLYKKEFELYLKLLLKWNKVYNLTSITAPEEIMEKHFEDSLAVLPYLSGSGSLLDVGSGAGFPGIPIKIARPALSVTLVEATKKKCNFCDTVIRELGLKNIKVVHGRVEDSKTAAAIGKFDIIVSRATFSLEKLVSTAVPYLEEGGKIIAMKGRNCIAELKDATTTILRLKLKIAAEEDYKYGRLIIISR